MSQKFDCRQWAGFVVFAILMQSAGCGGPTAPKREYADVVGTVKYQGKPLTTGQVQFQPPSGTIDIGTIQADGTFTMKGTVGTNSVMIVSREGAPKEDETGPKVKKPYVEPKSHIPEKYGRPQSGLSFEVKPGKNTADFDLK